MNNDESYQEMEQSDFVRKRAKKKQKTGVIKHSQNEVTGKVQIDPHEMDTDHGVEFFQPIMEGDLVVGVIHKCSCGKTSELRFQYSDQ